MPPNATGADCPYPGNSRCQAMLKFGDQEIGSLSQLACDEPPLRKPDHVESAATLGEAATSKVATIKEVVIEPPSRLKRNCVQNSPSDWPSPREKRFRHVGSA